MTRATDITHAISIGVDAIGFIFYHQSARYLSVAAAKQLLQGLPALVSPVAVFVNPEASFVKHVLSELPIHCLQFHGDESPQFCEQFGCPYIKAVPAMSADAIVRAGNQYQGAAALLLDTPSSRRGGTGVPFDWAIIPQQLEKPVILAGGLDVQNVKAAIASCSPYAVDVCSGIEASPGIKDHDKMSQFVEKLWGENERVGASR